jgi:predicted GTPase
VIIGTPIDLRRVVKISKPSTRVKYELQEIGVPTLAMVLSGMFSKKGGTKKTVKKTASVNFKRCGNL